MTSKYRAKPCVIDGLRFASQKEGRRYQELKLLAKAGQISDLECQVKFPLEVNGIKVCTYIADFIYRTKDRRVITEDVKGVLTPVYRLKKKLMLAIKGITISEV